MKLSKKNVINTISWIPAIIVLTIIIMLTLQNGDTSKETSEGIAITMGAKHLDSFNGILRTCAHVLEYMALSLMVGLAVTVNGIRKKLRFIYMFLMCMTCAVIDEFIQIFVPGRYCDIKDLICDGFGIIVVALVVYFLGKLRKPELKRESDESIRRRFLNILVDDISFDDAIHNICDMASEHKQRYIITPNSDHVIKMQQDQEFYRILMEADLILTDGTPLMWIADSLGYPIKEKIPGSDIFPRICEEAVKRNLTIFILGAGEGVASQAAKNLKARYKGLKIVKTLSPSMNISEDEEEIASVIECVNSYKPDILVISLGSPKQEKFIYRHRHLMEFGVALPIGAAVDFEAGNIRRAPRWMRNCGLEWLYRFLQEPGRLFKRYFIDDMKIFYIAWKYRNED